MNIVELLNEQVKDQPYGAAILDRNGKVDRKVTFRELDHWSNSIACDLQKAGLKRGDTVLVLHPVKAELYAILLAIFRCDMVAMILDPSAGPSQIQNCFAIKKPDAIIFSGKATLLLATLPALRQVPLKFTLGMKLPGLRKLRLHGEEPCAMNFDPHDSNHETPALITFTSGSTGAPKAIMRTQEFLLAQHESVNGLTRAGVGDVQLVTLPVFVLSNIAAGATSIIPGCDLGHPEKISPKAILEQASRLEATQILASPAFVKVLADYLLQENEKSAQIRKIFTGGGPIFGPDLELIGKAFDTARVCAVYGSTEAEPIAHVWLDEISASDLAWMSKGKGLLVGRTDQAVQLAIASVDPSQKEIVHIDEIKVRAGAAGEILVSGPHVIKSYLNEMNPANKINIGGKIWHRTGDAGFIDSAGRLWLLGRHQSRVTNAGGADIYPFQVEGVVAAIPGVRRSAIIDCAGIATLVVEAERSSQVSSSLSNICRHFGIKNVVFLSRMPMDRRHHSKLDYSRLKAAVAAGMQ